MTIRVHGGYLKVPQIGEESPVDVFDLAKKGSSQSLAKSESVH